MKQLTAPALVSMLVAVLLSACSENKEPDAATPAETAQSRQEAASRDCCLPRRTVMWSN